MGWFMRVFLDFEASSLSKKDSYPIEVGWVYEDGREAAYLIRPAPKWVEWDEAAQAVHGISRKTLMRDGTPHDVVCDRLVAALKDHDIYASSASWDGHWLSMLLRGAGKPRHMMRLHDSDEAFAEAAWARLGPEADEAEVADAIARAREAVEVEPASHRALADARREWRIWQELMKPAGT